MGKLHQWGTREELLHPRGYHGRFRTTPNHIVDRIMRILDSFNYKEFPSDQAAANYIHTNGQANVNLRNARAEVDNLINGYSNINTALQSGQLTPEQIRVRDAIDKTFVPTKDDLLLTQALSPEVFGLDTANIAHVQDLEGLLISNKGYSSTNLGTPASLPGPHITMSIAAPRGTPALMPSTTKPTREVILPRDQNLRITKVDPDGQGGFYVYAVAMPKDEGNVAPETNAPGGGFAKPSAPEQPQVPSPAPAPVQPAPAAPSAPSVPSPGTSTRNEPIHAETVGAQPSLPTTTPAPGAGASTPPPAATVAEGKPDIRKLVREAQIPSPSPGNRRSQWNKAYLGIASGKKHPEDVLRDLESDIAHNEHILAQDKADGTDSGPLPNDIKLQKDLAALIRHHFIPAEHQQPRPQETPAPSAPEPKAPAVRVPRPTGQEKQDVADLTPDQRRQYHQLRREGQSHSDALSSAKKATPTPAPKKVAEKAVPTPGAPSTKKAAAPAVAKAAPNKKAAAPAVAEAAPKKTVARKGSLAWQKEKNKNLLMKAAEEAKSVPGATESAAGTPSLQRQLSNFAESQNIGNTDLKDHLNFLVVGVSDRHPEQRKFLADLIKRIDTNEGAPTPSVSKAAPKAVPAKAVPENVPTPEKLVPKRVGSTAVGKNTASRLRPGDKILATQWPNGSWHPAIRKTGATEVTITGKEIGARRQSIIGTDANGNEIKIANIAGHQTFFHTNPTMVPEKKAAPEKVTAPTTEAATVQGIKKIAQGGFREQPGAAAGRLPPGRVIKKAGGIEERPFVNDHEKQQALDLIDKFLADAKDNPRINERIGSNVPSVLETIQHLRSNIAEGKTDKNSVGIVMGHMATRMGSLSGGDAGKASKLTGELGVALDDLFKKQDAEAIAAQATKKVAKATKVAKKAVPEVKPAKVVPEKPVSRTNVKNGEVLVWHPPGESPQFGKVFKEPGKSARVRWESGRTSPLSLREPNIRRATGDEILQGSMKIEEARGAEADRLRSISRLTGDIEHALDSGGSITALTHRVNTIAKQGHVEGPQGDPLRKAEDELKKAIATGRPTTIRRAIDKINRDNNIKVVGGRSGEASLGSSKLHESIGVIGRSGVPTTILRPAHEITLSDGTKITERGVAIPGAPVPGEKLAKLPKGELGPHARQRAINVADDHANLGKEMDYLTANKAEPSVMAERLRASAAGSTDPEVQHLADSLAKRLENGESPATVRAAAWRAANGKGATRVHQAGKIVPYDEKTMKPLADWPDGKPPEKVYVVESGTKFSDGTILDRATVSVVPQSPAKAAAAARKAAKAEATKAQEEAKAAATDGHALSNPKVTVAQVRAYAKETGIKIPTKLRTKADLIQHIRAQEALKDAQIQDIGKDLPENTATEIATQFVDGNLHIQLPNALEKATGEDIRKAAERVGITIPAGLNRDEALKHTVQQVALNELKSRAEIKAAKAAKKVAKAAPKKESAPSVRAIMNHQKLERPKSIPANRALNQATADLMGGQSAPDVAAKLREQAKVVDAPDAKILNTVADGLTKKTRTATAPLSADQLGQIKDFLAKAQSRQEAQNYLEKLKLTIPQIRQVHEYTKTISLGRTKAELINGLVEGNVGSRLDHAVLRKGSSLEERSGLDPKKAVDQLTEAAKAKPGQIPHVMSTKPILPNNWGGAGGEIHFHDDGAIGMGLRAMGEDRNLNVDGEPLANVLGKWATDLVRGRKTTNQVLADLRGLEARLPGGSKAKEQVARMIERIDTPARAPLKLPEGTPQPLVDLMEKFSQIPLARGDARFGEPSDMDRLAALAQAWVERIKEYRAGGLNEEAIQKRIRNFLPSDLHSKIYNHQHESQEGKLELDRAVTDTIKQIEGK